MKDSKQQAEPMGDERRIMQLAAISTAAMGYWKEGDSIHPDYDSTALRDTAKLYAKYDELCRAAQSGQRAGVAEDAVNCNLPCGKWNGTDLTACRAAEASRYLWLTESSGLDLRTLLGVGDFTSLAAFIDQKRAAAPTQQQERSE